MRDQISSLIRRCPGKQEGLTQGDGENGDPLKDINSNKLTSESRRLENSEIPKGTIDGHNKHTKQTSKNPKSKRWGGGGELFLFLAEPKNNHKIKVYQGRNENASDTK